MGHNNIFLNVAEEDTAAILYAPLGLDRASRKSAIANGTEGWRSRSAEVEVLARDSESGSDAF